MPPKAPDRPRIHGKTHYASRACGNYDRCRSTILTRFPSDGCLVWRRESPCADAEAWAAGQERDLAARSARNQIGGIQHRPVLDGLGVGRASRRRLPVRHGRHTPRTRRTRGLESSHPDLHGCRPGLGRQKIFRRTGCLHQRGRDTAGIGARLLLRSSRRAARPARLLTALAERAPKSPAFLGWDLLSDPHVINWAEATYLSHAEYCYCPNTVAYLISRISFSLFFAA